MVEYNTVVVIGVSAGGLHALEVFLPALPAGFGIPVIVVSHRHPDSDDYLERHMDGLCLPTVKQAEEGETVAGGTVYFAPPGVHLRVTGERRFTLGRDEPVNYARPSIDVLFEAAAGVYGPSLTGVILTGANNDGSRGLKKVKEQGGLTIVQDPATAEVPQMPAAAIAVVNPHYILPLGKIVPFLVLKNPAALVTPPV